MASARGPSAQVGIAGKGTGVAVLRANRGQARGAAVAPPCIPGQGLVTPNHGTGSPLTRTHVTLSFSAHLILRDKRVQALQPRVSLRELVFVLVVVAVLIKMPAARTAAAHLQR